MYYKKGKVSLYYEKHGTNNTKILILPGWGNTRETFNYLISCLEDYYTIYILDYPGFGNSSFPNHDLTIYDYTKLIISFIKDNNIDNPTIISHSFGGRILTLMSGFYKIKLDKLIMIDVSPIKPRKSLFSLIKQYTYKFLKKISSILPNKIKKKYLQKLINIFGSDDYKNLSINMQNTFKNIVNEDLYKYLKNISNETLIIWGEKDIDTPLIYGKKIKKQIKNSALIVIPNSYHFPYLDYPILIYKIIKEFLK